MREIALSGTCRSLPAASSARRRVFAVLGGRETDGLVKEADEVGGRLEVQQIGNFVDRQGRVGQQPLGLVDQAPVQILLGRYTQMSGNESVEVVGRDAELSRPQRDSRGMME